MLCDPKELKEMPENGKMMKLIRARAGRPCSGRLTPPPHNNTTESEARVKWHASLFQWTVVPVPVTVTHLAEGPGGVVPALETGQGLQVWVGRLARKADRPRGHPPLCRPAMEVGHVRRQAEAHALGQPIGAQEETGTASGDRLPAGVGDPHPGGVQDPVAPRVFPGQARWRRRGGLDPRQALPEGAPPAWARAQASSRAWPSRAERAVSSQVRKVPSVNWRLAAQSPRPKYSTPSPRRAENRHPRRGGRPGDRSHWSSSRAIPWARMSSRGRDASGRWRSSHRAVSRTSQAASLTGSMTGRRPGWWPV